MRKTTILTMGVAVLAAMLFAGCHATTHPPGYFSSVRLEPSAENPDEFVLRVNVWKSMNPRSPHKCDDKCEIVQCDFRDCDYAQGDFEEDRKTTAGLSFSAYCRKHMCRLSYSDWPEEEPNLDGALFIMKDHECRLDFDGSRIGFTLEGGLPRAGYHVRVSQAKREARILLQVESANGQDILYRADFFVQLPPAKKPPDPPKPPNAAGSAQGPRPQKPPV